MGDLMQYQDIEPGCFLQKRESVLEESRKPPEVRAWIHAAVKPTTQLYQDYRVYANAVDIDKDIGEAAFAFGKPCVDPELHLLKGPEAQYILRLLWRFLLRDLAICDAPLVSAELMGWGEPWYWLCWRRKDYLLPRLFAAVASGFLVLSASSGLFDAIQRLSAHAVGVALLSLLSVAIVYALACAEVQRRVGRRPKKVILRRGLYVTGLGLLYAIAGGVIEYAAASHLNMPWMTPRLMIVWSASALLLGFILQLFWEERPLGDPL